MLEGIHPPLDSTMIKLPLPVISAESSCFYLLFITSRRHKTPKPRFGLASNALVVTALFCHLLHPFHLLSSDYPKLLSMLLKPSSLHLLLYISNAILMLPVT